MATAPQPPPLIADLRRAVAAFDPGPDADAGQGKRRLLRLLEQSDAALDRRHYEPGHVTASGIVLSPDRTDVLLVYHRRLERWLQPGGHVEREDDSLADAAMREVFEETGVVTRHAVARDIVGVDVHEIPPTGREPAHLHHDVAWLFFAAHTRLGPSGARQRAVWCPIDGLHRYGADGPLLRSVARALVLL